MHNQRTQEAHNKHKKSPKCNTQAVVVVAAAAAAAAAAAVAAARVCPCNRRAGKAALSCSAPKHEASPPTW